VLSGPTSPKSPQEASAQSNQMVDKLSRENGDLKRQLDFMKKTYKTKLDDLRIMLGIDCDLEALIKARPNSKEQNVLKFYKEARERAETLGRINKDLEAKYWRQFRTMEGKIDRFRQDIDK